MALALIVAGCGKNDRAAVGSARQGSPSSADADSSSMDRSAASQPSEERPTIVFVGTSLTAGLGLADPDEAYPALIQGKLDSLGLK
jgi:acyl-CoA thioesterase-1